MSLLYDQLEEEVVKGNVKKGSHGLYPLELYNYTESCQFDRSFNPINSQARGIVFRSDTKELVAYPFPRMYQLGDLVGGEKDYSLITLPSSIDSITTKEDGSLIIGFINSFTNQIDCCTRGSFQSPQAILGKQLLEKLTKKVNLSTFKNITLLFELVGPSNKNVCRTIYKTDELILLGAYERTYERSRYYLNHISQLLGCLLVKEYMWADTLLDTIINDKNPDHEGIVITLRDNRRIKVKSDLYKSLHRVITGVFTKVRLIEIWSSWNNSGSNELKELISQCPDEFFDEIRDRMSSIDSYYLPYSAHASLVAESIMSMKIKNCNRKDIATLPYHKNHMYLLTPILDRQIEVCDLEPLIREAFIKSYLRD